MQKIFISVFTFFILIFGFDSLLLAGHYAKWPVAKKYKFSYNAALNSYLQRYEKRIPITGYITLEQTRFNKLWENAFDNMQGKTVQDEFKYAELLRDTPGLDSLFDSSPTFTITPLPGTGFLIGSGLGIVAFARRRHKYKAKLAKRRERYL